jgi:hypothetical protein
MSLLPSFSITYSNQGTATQTSALASLKEWDVDFDTGQMTGQLVTGTRAVEVWIWKCLQTQRFRHAIYSWQYGSELESYIGKALQQEYIDTDVRLAIEDALLINPEIESITDFDGQLDGDTLHLAITVNTIYGSATVSTEVNYAG